jgi:hypothetical protein
MALESTAKIAVNLVITAIAGSALAQLLPYHWLQQEKLREISTEVSRNFDPQQTKSIMQQQGYRFAPNQRRIVLMNQDRQEDEQIESSP